MLVNNKFEPIKVYVNCCGPYPETIGYVLRWTKTFFVVWNRYSIYKFNRKNGRKCGKQEMWNWKSISLKDVENANKMVVDFDKRKPVEYVSSFCKCPHRLSNGKPIKHKCDQLTIEFMYAELFGLTSICEAMIERDQHIKEGRE